MPVKRKIFGLTGLISIATGIIIAGLLFKIQHWEYASTIITADLIVQAILFVLIGIVIFRSMFDKKTANPTPQ